MSKCEKCGHESFCPSNEERTPVETPSRLVWVIEKGSPAQYFAGFNYGAGKWTAEFSEAHRSADREVMQRLWDCDKPIFTIFNDDCRIADHVICGGPASEGKTT